MALFKPNVIRENAVKHPKKDVKVGYVGYDKVYDEKVFTTLRDRNRHYYRKGEGYAISEKILSTLRANAVEKIYVHEKNSGDVYQFTLEQFLAGPKLEHMAEDTQRLVKDDDATDYWEDVGFDLYDGDENDN